jgi:hypothetical protein
VVADGGERPALGTQALGLGPLVRVAERPASAWLANPLGASRI